jgi:hypothetical protein
MIYLIMDLVFFFVGGLGITTSALHLMGATIGFPLAVIMLKKKWVDCEGWDLMSVWSGKEGRWMAAEPTVVEAKKEDAEARRLQRENALQLLRTHLSENNTRAALVTFQKEAGADARGWEPPAAELAALINALHQENMWGDSIPLMVQAVRRFPEKAAPIRLKLAQILVQVEHRPKQALAVLSKLPDRLPDTAIARRQQLKKLAHAAIEEGDLELDLHDW